MSLLRQNRRVNVAIGVATLLVVAYGVIVWIFSSMILTGDNADYTAADETELTNELALSGLGDPEPVAVQVDDVEIVGSFYANPSDAQCAVVYLHARWGNRLGALWYAPLFWDNGCDVLVYDLSGHGQSGEEHLTYGVGDRRDAAAVISWLEQQHGLLPEQVGLVGFSLGAVAAIQTSAEVDELAFVIADSAFSDLEGAVSDEAAKLVPGVSGLFTPSALWLAGRRAGFDVAEASPRKAASATDVPLLLIHSTTDEQTAPSHSEEILLAADRTNAELELTDWGAGHIDSYWEQPEEYEKLIDEFLGRHVENWPNRRPAT